MCSEDEFKKVERLYLCENENNSEHDVSAVSDTDDFSSNTNFLTDTLNIECELSLQDIQEEEVVCKFFEDPCCNKRCNFLIPRDMIMQSRNNILELEKNQQDLIILSKIEAGKPTSALDKAYESILGKKNYGQHGNVTYAYHKLPICRTLFLFLYACGIKRYKALLNHFNDYGVVERIHGKTNKASSNPLAMRQDEISKIIEFIKSVADRLAVPLPGRLPKFKDYSVMKLPSSETKSSIYRIYIAALDAEERKASVRTFQNIWNKYVPYVTVMKPSDDLCDVCRGKIIFFFSLKFITR